MESEQNIARAKKTIRDIQLRVGNKRGARIHVETADENRARLAALDNECGKCRHLILEFRHRDGKDVATLSCRREFNQIRLYQNFPFERPNCPSFDPNTRLSNNGLK